MDELNQWLTLLANIGVVVGIAFLAYEIRQSTKASHAQTREAVLSATQAELKAVRDDANLVKCIVKKEPLTADEQIRLFTWLVSALRVREFSWLQRKHGVIDDEQWKSELAVTLAILEAPRVRQWWRSVGCRTVSDEFASFVDEQIQSVPESNGIYDAQMRWANDRPEP